MFLLFTPLPCDLLPFDSQTLFQEVKRRRRRSLRKSLKCPRMPSFVQYSLTLQYFPLWKKM